ncbi:hypothetical protein DFH06DRAFT_284956 [Mycena polygramma]|nr:hypothetical protein DFH06DRAFT_284956 [Mycena polygramma]
MHSPARSSSGMDLTVLSSTNCAPSQFEAEQIIQLIHQGEETISQLDDEISRTSDTLAKLQQRRETHREEIRSLRGLVSPIRRFPPEILAEIFVLCMRDSILLRSSTSFDPCQPPLLFGRVSSIWRTISLTTPRLWNNLRLSPKTPVTRGVVSFAELFVQRSRPIPLRLDMDIVASEYIGTPLTVMWSFSSRLVFLRLEVPLPYLQPLVGMPDHMFPALRSLEIHITSCPSRLPSLVRTITAFATSSLLQSLELTTPRPMAFLRLLPHFPWAQLATFHLKSSDSPLLTRSILSKCTALENCSIIVRDYPTHPHPVVDVESCILPEMRTFTYVGSVDEEEEDEDTVQFLKVFSFPNLRSLSLGMIPECGQILSELHQRSQFGLETLTLNPAHSTTEEIIDLLSKLPTLKNLGLTHNDDGAEDALLKALTHSELDTRIVILPQLESLAIRVAPNTRNSVLFDMIESRWWPDPAPNAPPPPPSPVSRLRKVALELYHDMPLNLSPGLQARLDTMKAAGVLDYSTFY